MSTLSPRPTGFNEFSLEKEAQMRAFFKNLLSAIVPDEQPPIDFGPLNPPDKPMFAPNSQISARDNTIGGYDRGMMPDLGALLGPRATPNSTPNLPSFGAPGMMTPGINSDAPPPEIMELTDKILGNSQQQPSMRGSGPPPEIMALTDQILSSKEQPQASFADAAGGSSSTAPPMQMRAPMMPKPKPRAPMGMPRSIGKTMPAPRPMQTLTESPATGMDTSSIAALLGVEPPMEDIEVPEETMMMDDELPEGDGINQDRTDAYLDFLSAKPARSEHRGSLGRRIGSVALKALFGGDLGLGDAPYRHAIQDWQDSGSGLKEGADIEQAGLKEQRLGKSNQQRHERGQAQLTLQARKLKQDYEARKRELEEVKIPAEKRKARELELDNDYNEALVLLKKAGLDQGQQKINLSARRTAAYEKSVDNSSKGSDKPVAAREQAAIRKEAIRQVMQDPRFAEWFIPEMGQFGDIPQRNAAGEVERERKGPNKGEIIYKKKLDPATKKMLMEALAKAESRIATKKRSSYTPGPLDSGSLLADDEDDEDDY